MMGKASIRPSMMRFGRISNLGGGGGRISNLGGGRISNLGGGRISSMGRISNIGRGAGMGSISTIGRVSYQTMS